MKQMRFPYLKYLVTPPTEKPPQYVYRPVISTKLLLDKNVITFDALVDSGADECTFPGWTGFLPQSECGTFSWESLPEIAIDNEKTRATLDNLRKSF